MLKNNKLDYLQSLRCLAVFLIIWHHSSFLLGSKQVDKLLGFTGVPLFFIISGFIMVYTTRNISSNPVYNFKDFTIKRLIRIVPLFYFAIVVWLIIWRKGFMSDPQWDRLLETAFFLPHFTDTLGPFYGFWILGVNWSLNYEMFFYFLFAISFFFADKRYYFLYIVFLVLLIGIPFVINGSISWDRSDHKPYAYEYFNLMSNPILWFFIIGMSIGLLIDKIMCYVQNTKIIYVFWFSSIIFFFAYITKHTPSGLWVEMIASTGIILGALLMDLTKSIRINPPRFIVYLGDISYSIYLMHSVIYMYVPLVAAKYGLEHQLKAWYSFYVVLLLIIICSSCTYYLIEKKFTSFLRKKIN